MTIYGLHDLSERGANLMGGGWLVDAVAVGHNPTDSGGANYRHWTNKGCTIICRLNNGWNPEGTIPQPAFYDDFAQRCANFVHVSHGCHIWIIGNEWNLKIERPYGRIVSTSQYVSCYKKVRAAIKVVAPDDWVVPAAIGTWNVESGDWLELYRDVLQQVEADAICWHVYSHGYDPVLVTSEATMDPPYANRRYHFRCYKDFEIWTPDDKKHLPVLVTEANGDGPWQATGWISAAYEEIQQSAMDIRCLCLFRAEHTGDGWGLTEEAWAEFEHALQANDDGNGGSDMLQNGSFDGAWGEQDGISQLKVFKPWRVWWDEEPGDGNIDRPEAGPIGEGADEASRRRSAPTAQKIWHNHATWRGGLHQTVDVPAGSYATFRIWFRQDTPQTGGGQGYSKVGIDPAGGTDPHSPSVVWGADVWENYAQFIPLEISAVSQGKVTVFTFSSWKWPADWNDTYWDDADLSWKGQEIPPSGNGLTEEQARQIFREELSKLRLVLD